MIYDKCYFDEDLRLYFFSMDEQKECREIRVDKSYDSFYRLIFLENYGTRVILNNSEFVVNSPSLIVVKPETDIKLLNAVAPLKVLHIDIHPNVFSGLPDIDKYLLFFYKLNGEKRIFNVDDPRYNSIVQYIYSIQAALFAKCGRFSVETRIKALITELSLIYETEYTEYVSTTDSVPAQIIDYVNKHYLEKISLQVVSSKFFVSYNTINAIFKRITGNTFKRYVTLQRLKTANEFIKSGKHTIGKIAILSGYSDYATFLRAYSKEYGVLPSKAMKKDYKYFPLK